jgi:ComF family protein
VTRWQRGWRELVRDAESWLLPAACLGCGRAVVGEDEPLACDLCRTRWRRPPAPLCTRCGQPRPLNIECRICADWPPDFGPVRSAVMIDPSVRSLLHQFKYHGWRRLADQFALAMEPICRDLPGNAQLVPIPLAGRRRRVRGYNQAAMLARAVAVRIGLPVAEDRLVRVRETTTQTRLGASNRRANLAGAFEAREDQVPAVLVDDVFTTGATLVSASGALLDAGAEQVLAVTFARAEAPLAGAARNLTRLDRGAGYPDGQDSSWHQWFRPDRP